MPVKVLMVCLGNICRSPLAEGILRSKVNPDNVFVDSAGTAGYHIGEPPDPRSVSVAAYHGIGIQYQRCRKFMVDDFEGFDYIFVMDRSNLHNVLKQAPNVEVQSKVSLLLEAGGLSGEVPDPYYGGEDGFEKVFQMIDQACDTLAQKLDPLG